MTQPIQQPSDRSQPWLAAIAIVPILATVFQTFVLTDVVDDVIRKGLEAEHYSMIWPQILWGIGLLYGVFTGIWASSRYGARDTLLAGLGLFAVGNVLCGAALDVSAMIIAKLVEGLGKGMVIVICRSLLLRQFDRLAILGIGFYGIIAYATRPTTPFLTSFINECLGWRWIYWVNVPLALLAFPLVLRFIRPDRPAQPRPLPIDWLALSGVAGWAVSMLLTVAKKENIQFFIETHSEHVLHTILNAVAKGEWNRDEVALHYFQNKNGVADVSRREINQFGQVDGGLPDFFEQSLAELTDYLKAVSRP